jgi:GNAT superfamily N-acetyltransferase
LRYPKECILKECEEAIIRPLEKSDEPLLRKFYDKTTEKERWYMRASIEEPDFIQKRLEAIEEGTVFSIIGLCHDEIMGIGTLYLRAFGATRHVGRFRIIVLPEYRKKRLGTWLLLDLVQIAMDKGLEALRADLVVGVEDAAIEAVTEFDFFKEAVLRDYVKDPEGKRHDLAIMIKHLHRGWSDF